MVKEKRRRNLSKNSLLFHGSDDFIDFCCIARQRHVSWTVDSGDIRIQVKK